MTDPSMVQHSSSSPAPQHTGEPALPAEVPAIRRIQTLHVMMNSIESCSRALHVAHTKFQEAKTASDADMKQSVHAARQSVREALNHLHPINTLVHLGPNQVVHMAQCLNTVVAQMHKMDRISQALVQRDKFGHTTWALTALAMACPRTSYKLENDLGVPIRQARDKIAQMSVTPDALTA